MKKSFKSLQINLCPLKHFFKVWPRSDLFYLIVVTIVIVPLILPTLFGKRGIFARYLLPWVFHPLSFCCYRVCLPRFVLLSCLISLYLKLVTTAIFIVQYFPNLLGSCNSYFDHIRAVFCTLLLIQNKSSSVSTVTGTITVKMGTATNPDKRTIRANTGKDLPEANPAA